LRFSAIAIAQRGEHQTTKVELLFSIILPQWLHFFGRMGCF